MVERLGFPSKIGVGVFSNLYDRSGSCVTAGQKGYAVRMGLIAQMRTDHYVAINVPPASRGLNAFFRREGLKDYCSMPTGLYSISAVLLNCQARVSYFI